MFVKDTYNEEKRGKIESLKLHYFWNSKLSQYHTGLQIFLLAYSVS